MYSIKTNSLTNLVPRAFTLLIQTFYNHLIPMQQTLVQ